MQALCGRPTCWLPPCYNILLINSRNYTINYGCVTEWRWLVSRGRNVLTHLHDNDGSFLEANGTKAASGSGAPAAIVLISLERICLCRRRRAARSPIAAHCGQWRRTARAGGPGGGGGGGGRPPGALTPTPSCGSVCPIICIRRRRLVAAGSRDRSRRRIMLEIMKSPVLMFVLSVSTKQMQMRRRFGWHYS